MIDDIGPPPLRLQPTPQRPLLGLTALLVEDSRCASEAIRLMCLRSGARIRRADSLRSAHRHLAAYRPAVAIVDLGLPDGSGLDLLSDLANGPDPLPVLLATSGDDGLADAARAAGAHGFLGKPLSSLAGFQDAILSHLPDQARPRGPRVVPADSIAPDAQAYRDDMAHVLDLLSDAGSSPDTLGYAAQFARMAALSAGDACVDKAATMLGDALSQTAPHAAALAQLHALAFDRCDTRAVV
jgi:CheY-like chemotaxis protein